VGLSGSAEQAETGFEEEREELRTAQQTSEIADGTDDSQGEVEEVHRDLAEGTDKRSESASQYPPVSRH
jgi:hypothetical protein